MATWRGWTTGQRFAIVLALYTTVLGLVGLAINPDFAVGDDATAKTFIVSWNGWHAVAALSVGLPGLLVARLPEFAVPYLIARAVSDAGAALWAALDDHPLGVLYLPDSSDAVLNVVIALTAAAGIVVARRQPRDALGHA